MTPEEQQQAAASNAEAQRINAGLLGDSNDQLTKLAQALLNLNKQIARTPEAIRAEQRAHEEMAEAEKKRAKGLQQVQDVQNAFTDTLRGGLSVAAGFVAGLSNAKVSLTNFNQGLTSIGGVADSIGKNFGMLGGAVALNVQVYTEALKLNLAINQAYIDGRDRLIKMGGAGTVTAESFKTMAANAKLNFISLERLIKPLENLGKGVLVLGRDVGEAQQNFAKLNYYTDEELEKYIRLGATQEDLMASSADYIALQARAGRDLNVQAQDFNKIHKAQLSYLESTLALAAATGQSVEEQKKQQDFALTQQNFQLKLIEMQAREAEMRKRAEGAAPGQRESLLAEADKLKTERESIKNLVAMIGNAGLGTTQTNAMIEAVVKGGVLGPEAANLSILPGAIENLTDLMRRAESGEFARADVKRGGAMIRDLMTGSIGDAMTGGMLQAFQNSPDLARMAGLTDEQTRTAAQNTIGIGAVKVFDESLGKIVDQRETYSEAAAAAALAQKTQQQLGVKLEELAEEFAPLGTAIKDLTDKITHAMEMFGLLALGKGLLALANLRAAGLMTQAAKTVIGGGATLTAGEIAAGGVVAAGGATAARGAATLTAAEAAQVGPEFMASLAAKQGVTAAATAGAEVAGETAAAGVLTRLGITGTLTAGTMLASGGLTLGGALASAGGDYLTEKGYKKTGAGVDILGDVMTGAGAGAGVGALFGGIGAVPGALIGGAGGLLYGIGRWGKQLLGANEATEDSIEKDKELQKVLPKLVDSTIALDKAFRLLTQTVGGVAAGQGAGATPGAQPGAQPGAAPAGAAGPEGVTREQLQQAGLRLKEGDVQAEGARIDPLLLQNAKAIQDLVPGFSQFTAFNDEYHQKNKPRSHHAHGSALDFTLTKRPTEAEGKRIKRQLESMGFSYVQDEYNFPSEGSTGGHIHVQLANGGFISGPKSGFPIMAHGQEVFVPLKPGSILAEMGQKSRQDMQDVSHTLNIKSGSTDSYKEILGQNQNMMNMLANKLDKVTELLDLSNTTQRNILRYAKA